MKHIHVISFLVFLTVLNLSFWYKEAYRNSTIIQLKKQLDEKDKLLEQYVQEKEELKRALEKNQQVERIILPRRESPLPVCAKGEVSAKCRQMAADEMGATVRGAREDEED